MVYISENAPIPPANSNRKGTCRFPFAQLEIGHSFFVANKNDMPPGEDISDASTLGNMTTHVSRHNNKLMPDKKFRCRIYPVNKQWIQVWREA